MHQLHLDSAETPVQNPYAAMPSLHFGYAWIIGISLFCHEKHFRGKLNFLALLYPLSILLAIIVTANHYLVDAVCFVSS